MKVVQGPGLSWAAFVFADSGKFTKFSFFQPENARVWPRHGPEKEVPCLWMFFDFLN